MKSESITLARLSEDAPNAAQAVKNTEPLLTVGRYVLYDEIAAGGMATVHYGRLLGRLGFSRTVAIKRMHAHVAKDPDFLAMFVDEARILGRVRHPNVVPMIDVVARDAELLLVMEYVQGETLSQIHQATRRVNRPIPLAIMAAIFVGVLEGLHAAHEAVNEQGEPLDVVHRDISPQNIMVGQDGVPRVIDWGVAVAAGRIQSTRTGQVKGKVSYMAPEQITRGGVDRRADIYSTGVTMWEVLTGHRLFKASNEVARFHAVLNDPIPHPSSLNPLLPPALNDLVVRATQKDPQLRFRTAQEMAVALEKAVQPASSREVGKWVEQAVGSVLKTRRERVAEIESVSTIVPLNEDLTPSGFSSVSPEDGPASRIILLANQAGSSERNNLGSRAPRRRRAALAGASLAAVFVWSVSVGWGTKSSANRDPDHTASSPASSHATTSILESIVERDTRKIAATPTPLLNRATDKAGQPRPALTASASVIIAEATDSPRAPTESVRFRQRTRTRRTEASPEEVDPPARSAHVKAPSAQPKVSPKAETRKAPPSEEVKRRAATPLDPYGYW